jgi:hypothetical protein
MHFAKRTQMPGISGFEEYYRGVSRRLRDPENKERERDQIHRILRIIVPFADKDDPLEFPIVRRKSGIWRAFMMHWKS